jgi:L-ascorbate metabolism protein UlaG (beta-lactamase superfamily)
VPEPIPRRAFAAAPLLLAACAEAPIQGVAMSAHFDGARFRNPDGEAPRSLLRVLQWQLTESAEPWPDHVPSPFPADRPPRRVDGPDLRISFVGHASFLLQANGLNVLTDPVWSDRASPFGFTGPKRRNPPGIAFENLPPVDVVLLSHGHYDHLDLATIARLWDRDRPRIIAPLGHDSTIAAHRADIAVTTADWHAEVALAEGVTATLEPVHHWTARGVFDRNRALWCGFVVKGMGPALFFAGDTGFDDGKPFRAVARKHGRLDLALLPIGAYEPRWFMSAQHMNPEEAVMGLELLGARQALGYHWGTFQLTNEGAEQPAIDLAAAIGARRIEPARFPALRPGQVWSWGA